MFNESLSKKIFNDSIFKIAATILISVSAVALLLWVIDGTLSLLGALAVCITIAITTTVLDIWLFWNSKNC